MPTLAELHEQLKWKERALTLILEIDRVRDQAATERELTAAMMSTLTESVEAELGLLWLLDEDAPDGAHPAAQQLQLRAVVDRARVYDTASAPALRELALRAAAIPTAHFERADLQLRDKRLTYCLAAPLRIGDEMLGVVLLLNADRPFNGPEHDLVEKAISQIDSALQQARVHRDLRRRTRELEVIARIDRIRDAQTDFQSLLDAVLAEICQAIAAETGFLLLYDQAGVELELRAATDHDFLATAEATAVIRVAAQEALTAAELVRRTPGAGGVRSLLAAPLILHEKLIGVLGVANRKDQPVFSRSDEQMLRAIASQIDTAIFESLQTQRLRNAFGQSVGPRVMERLLALGGHDPLSGERRPVTTLFSDIRGFTHMSEQLAPEVLQAVMNDHLSALTELVLKYEGTLDKYIGDCVMCFFNAPEDQPDHALRAVRLALEMQAAHRQVMARWEARVALPGIGIGISTGETMVGNFGSVKRLEYTALGRDVNLAARLCGAAEAEQILIGDATYALVHEYVVAEAQPAQALKGIDGEVACWSVRGLQ